VGAFALAAEARSARIGVQMELAGRSLKGQLKQASRVEAAYVAHVGADSIEIKDMTTGEQEPVPGAAAAVARVLKGRHPA
jgi:histidyl-tRNA synthetase